MGSTETSQLDFRKIGNVEVFDLAGALVGEQLDPIVDKIEQAIRKKKLRRLILNLQKVQSIDEIALRKILAVLLRPQRSIIFLPEGPCTKLFEKTHIPANVKLCQSEEEVAEAFGSFLFVKDKAYEVPVDESKPTAPDYGMEKRRAKRIRVAIPVHIQCLLKDGANAKLKAIATNVSQGGLFAEFLDLNAPQFSKVQGLEGSQVTVTVLPNRTFKEELVVPGKINRFEVLKKQYAIAIQFM